MAPLRTKVRTISLSMPLPAHRERVPDSALLRSKTGAGWDAASVATGELGRGGSADSNRLLPSERKEPERGVQDVS